MRTRLHPPRAQFFLAILLATVCAMPLRSDQMPEALEGATRALYRGEYNQAASLLHGYLRSYPGAQDAQILLARVYIAQGHFEPALEELAGVLKGNPINPDVLYYVQWVSRLLSQMEFQHLLQFAPDSAPAHQVMGEVYETQNSMDMAETEYLAGLKVDPQFVETLDALGDLKRHQFKFEEAIAYYTRALDVKPHDYAAAYGLGAALLFKHDDAGAAKSLRLAVGIDPKSAAAHVALGDALLRQGHLPAAITELQIAVSLMPDMRQAYTLLARAYSILGRTAEANAALRKSQELNHQEIEPREDPMSSEQKAPQ